MVKAMLVCQRFPFACDLDVGNAFVQSDLCIAILFKNCETVAVKKFDHFLLVGEY